MKYGIPPLDDSEHPEALERSHHALDHPRTAVDLFAEHSAAHLSQGTFQLMVANGTRWVAQKRRKMKNWLSPSHNAEPPGEPEDPSDFEILELARELERADPYGFPDYWSAVEDAKRLLDGEDLDLPPENEEDRGDEGLRE